MQKAGLTDKIRNVCQSSNSTTFGRDFRVLQLYRVATVLEIKEDSGKGKKG